MAIWDRATISIHADSDSEVLLFDLLAASLTCCNLCRPDKTRKRCHPAFHRLSLIPHVRGKLGKSIPFIPFRTMKRKTRTSGCGRPCGRDQNDGQPFL
ncbi:hypothetical protein KCP71_08225 [Salmonella enterica subsp. enterica]|nr:hypothetical protein KCP71_08225 [Salmonella enterica subsp. enterica]